MPLLSILFDPLREFFTLRRAEWTVRGYFPAQHARAKALWSGGALRLRGGKRMLDGVPAAVLLREGLMLYLRAAEAVQRSSASDGTESATDRHLLSSLLPPVPPDPAAPETQAADDARVRAALEACDPLYFDRLSPADLERTRWALDRACGRARSSVEVRSALHLKALRWGRLAALLVGVSYAAFAFVRVRLSPVDVALGKPVHPSSRRAGEPEALVDGDVGTSFALETNTEDNPYDVIDLEGQYFVDRVSVHNRVDGWFDDCLPLVVELSSDGVHYDEVGRREQHFDADPPWVLATRGRVARFVRVRVARKSYLTLSEVEVFGRPRRP